MPSDTQMERLEAMAVDREVEAETIRGNKFRSHAYALEHELAASDLRWALSEIDRLTADCARKDAALNATVAAWESLSEGHHGSWAVQRWLVDKMKPAIDALRAAASARGEGSGR